jgi:hypothetical protein
MGGVRLSDLDWLGLAVVLSVVFASIMLVGRARLPRPIRRLVCAGLLLHVLGAVAYLAVFTTYYGGGDYRFYYQNGLAYAQRIWTGDFSMFFVSTGWLHHVWWGSQFAVFATTIVVSVIGPSMLAAFIVFALLSFLGLIGFGVAFRRTFPNTSLVSYLRWVVLFPSLWFWPSAIGKEAIILLGLGLCVVGYVGKRGRTRWIPVLSGLFLVFGIRPQVAAVVLASVLISQWLTFGERWTLAKTLQGVCIIGLALAGLQIASRSLGMAGADAEDVGVYMTARAEKADDSGTAVKAADVGWRGVPVAMTNILFRPFPWEVRSLSAALSCAEIVALWMIIIVRRRDVGRALRGWRSDSLRRVALCFVVFYATTLGMVVVNMGIIARQRILLFPFLFVFVEAVPAVGNTARVYAGKILPPRVGKDRPLARPESR